MSKRTLGILASVLGSAFGAWWVINQRRLRDTAGVMPAREKGAVIFDNTPVAADVDAIL